MDVESFLSLPTDSLYKFMALSGLLVVFGSFLLVEYFSGKLRQLYFDAKKRLSSHEVRTKWLDKRLSDFREDIQFLRRGVECGGESRGEEANFRELLSEHENRSAEYQRCVEEIEIVTCELNIDVEEAEYLYRKLKFLVWIQAFMVALGLVLSGSGFFLWYTKIQVYADIAIVRDAAK